MLLAPLPVSLRPANLECGMVGEQDRLQRKEGHGGRQGAVGPWLDLSSLLGTRRYGGGCATDTPRCEVWFSTFACRSLNNVKTGFGGSR